MLAFRLRLGLLRSQKHRQRHCALAQPIQNDGQQIESPEVVAPAEVNIVLHSAANGAYDEGPLP